jgi:endonuclease/exonuclease/phosphatase family metal-dependent hydrolase
MKIVSWNMRRATTASPAWQYFRELNPDVALLQEVGGLPRTLTQYHVAKDFAARKQSGRQKFSTVVLSRFPIARELDLKSDVEWVTELYEGFRGNILHCSIEIPSIGHCTLVSVHSPAWPIPINASWPDVAKIKLTQNSQLWLTEILWSLLQTTMPQIAGHWIIGGDFNSSETFDSWPGGPRGNREIIDRMTMLGLTECLRAKSGRLVPTFINAKNKAILHQMDHLYVSKHIFSELESCETGNEARVFRDGLSDHLPIIASIGRHSSNHIAATDDGSGAPSACFG